MEYEIKKPTPTTRELLLSFTASEFQPKVSASLSKIQKNANLKGFRKGKAPLTLIKRYFGKDVESEAMETLTTEHFEKICTDEKIAVVNKGKVSDFTVNQDGSLVVNVAFEALPDIKLASPLNSYTFEKNVYKIDDNSVAQELQHISERSGTWESVEGSAKKKNLVIVDVQHLDENGQAIIGKKQEGAEYLLDPNASYPDIVDALLGAKAGEERRISTRKKDQKTDKPLPASTQPISDLNFNATVREVKQLRPAELNDDFAKEYTQNAIQTLDDFKNKIKELLTSEYERRSRDELDHHIISKLIEDNAFEIPESLLKGKEALELSYIKSSFQAQNLPTKDGLNEKLAALAKEKAKRTAAWSVLSQNIAENLDIKVEESDFSTFFEQKAKSDNVPVDQIKQNYLSSETARYLLSESILSNKVLDAIYKEANITEKEKSYSNSKD